MDLNCSFTGALMQTTTDICLCVNPRGGRARAAKSWRSAEVPPDSVGSLTGDCGLFWTHPGTAATTAQHV